MKNVCLIFGIVAICFFIDLIMNDHSQAQKVVSFNQTFIKGQFIKQLAIHKVPEEKIVSKTNQFKNALHKALNEYAKQHHVVIIDSNSALANVPDVTSKVAVLTTKLMRKAT